FSFHHHVLHSFPTRRSSDLWRLVQHFVIAFGQVHRLQDIKVERVLDFALAVSRCKLQIDDDRISRIIWIELTKCLPDDLLVLPKDRKSTRLNSSHDQISYAV